MTWATALNWRRLCDKNSVIGDDCVISPYTVVEDARLHADCTVGPFARLRPGSELLDGAHVGNFVEMKKARLGKASKAGHSATSATPR